MRVAFICDTPYQTLNVMSLYWHNYRHLENIQADIFIVDQFRGAKEIYSRLVAENMFTNVFFLKREENRFMPQGWKRSVRVMYSYWNPRHALRNQMENFNVNQLVNCYDEIYASLVRCCTSALIKLNPKADFHLFEDGSGSYAGDLVINGGGRLYQLFSKVFRTGSYAARAKKLYVYSPSICRSTAADEICALPAMNPEFLQIAYRVFDIGEAATGKEILFLSQPADGQGAWAEAMAKMSQILDPWKDRIVVRMHPRDTAYELYSNFTIDARGDMWELKTTQMDLDKTVLIGYYSTAQMTPKMLYDKEPWLIFVCHIMNVSSPEEMANVDQGIEKIRQLYTNKDRIIVPRTAEELKAALEKVMETID